MSLVRLSRQTHTSLALSLTRITRHLSSAASSQYSRLRDHYNFIPPPSLSPNAQNPSPNSQKKKQKPQYKPPSSLEGIKKTKSDLPFDFRYSYTENSPYVRPIGLREPKFSPFGPGRLDREWTGVCAPARDTKVRSVDGGGEEGEEKKLEEKRRKMRERLQGEPLTEAERKILVEQCQRNKTKRQINLGILF